MAEKPTVAVLFGGRSTEHEVSLSSAEGVLQQIDRGRYEVVEVGVTLEGEWLCGPGTLRHLKELAVAHRRRRRAVAGAAVGNPPDMERPVAADAGTELRRCRLHLDPQAGGLLVEGAAGGAERAGNRSGRGANLPRAAGGRREGLPGPPDAWSPLPVDIFFLLIHGNFGEDGTLQGSLEIAGQAYTGAAPTASALAFDKDLARKVFVAAGLPVLPSLTLLQSRWEAEPAAVAAEVRERPGYPCFVKPACSGSSVGTSWVDRPEQLAPAVALALRFDRKLLIERAVQAREIEVAVLGNDEPRASVAGEVVPSGKYYDYPAKYLDGRSRTIIPAPLPPIVAEEARRLALAAYRALDCAGMARVDSFFLQESGELYVNEANTIPGFTPISMYPMMWEASGLSFPRLIDELIRLGLERRRLVSAKEFRLEMTPEEAARVGASPAEPPA